VRGGGGGVFKTVNRAARGRGERAGQAPRRDGKKMSSGGVGGQVVVVFVCGFLNWT
jgi:hypothetical protein